MATPGYYSNLTFIASADAGETWTEFTGAALGGTPAADTDYFIQGAGSCTAQITKTGWSSSAFDKGSPVSIAAGDAAFFWIWVGVPNCLQTETLCGLGVAMGSSIANWSYWKVGGSTTYAYGGWLNIAVDPTCAADGTYGSPTGSTQVFGSVINLLTAPARGYYYSSDCIRSGRSLICTGGDAGGYAEFAGAAAVNDTVLNRWGLCQANPGGYLVKGEFNIGTAATCADFRDSNTTVLLQDLPRVRPDFTRFVVNHVDSRLDWTAIGITSLGTNARGNFAASADADINIESCTFTDMGTFLFDSNSTINNSIFRRCGQVTQNNGVLYGCTFDSSYATVALCSDNPTDVSYCAFTSSGHGHAMEITTPGSYSFDGNTFASYGTSGTSDAAIYNNSGGEVTLNIAGGGDSSPTIRDGGGATTILCAGQINLTLTSVVACSEIRIYNAGTTTELAGVENSDTSFVYTYLYSLGASADIVVHHPEYEYYRVEDYPLGNSNASFPIAQQIDRQYSNP